jgi:protease-4
MQFSFLKELVTSPWQIDAITAQIYAPVFRGVLQGLLFEREEPDSKYLPYQVAAKQQSSAAENQQPNEAQQQINVQPLRGVMLKYNSPSGIIGTRTIAANLLKADKNTDVIGHILLIDSGGGQISAVPELSDAIKQLTKPIVAWVDGCMCSAAMYAGSYCKKIIASRDADSVGCIGTMIELSGFPKFNKEPDGFTYVRIYADQSTEKNDEYEAALTGDFKLVKERILNPHNEQFIATIRANRPDVKDEHLKGRTFKASEVVGTLIDSIGAFDTAVQAVLELNNSTVKQLNKSTIKQLNKSTMKQKLTALLTLLAVTELVVEEGQTSLNEQQLEAIEKALATANTAAGELATATAALQTANATIATRDATIAEQAKKISELEAAAGAPTATVVKPTDGGGEPAEPENAYQTVRNILKGANA